MAIIIICLIVSMIPSLLIYFWFAHMYKGDIEHTKTCRKLFGKGLICVFAIFGLDLIFNIIWNAAGLRGLHEVLDALFKCFIINAFVEEFVKLMYARRVIREQRDTISRLSFIMYTTIVAIGFGLAEDVIYAFGTSPGQILVRGITAGHVFYGLMTGTLLSKGYQTGKKSYRVLGVVLPWFMHGLYNFGLKDLPSLGEPLVSILPMCSLGLAAGGTVYIIVKLLKIRRYRNDPEYIRPIFDSPTADGKDEI